jgi:hypothetical protein
MKLSDLSEIEAIASVAERSVSPFEAHMAEGAELIKEYSWFKGKVKLKLCVPNAAVADQAIRTAEAVCLTDVSVKARIDTYLAIVSVKSMSLGDRTIDVESAPDWSTNQPFLKFSQQLSNEQMQLVVETHVAFQSWLDGQRRQLSSMA